MKAIFTVMIAGAVAGLIGIASPASARIDITYLDKFERTGEIENCIRSNRIKETKILDNETILFRTVGNTWYLNKLPQRCGGLRIENSFAYSTGGTTLLCSVDTIRTRFAPCGLGHFERIERKPADG
ncbi:MAG: hypothetical protein ACE363_04910 [Alphaproteobacteria bacterium]